jgi:hypothetical protein
VEDGGARIDTFTARTRSILELLRDAANDSSAVFFMVGNQLIFESITQIVSVDPSLDPSSQPDHHYVLTNDDNLHDDYLNIDKIEMRKLNEKTYTDFPVQGKREEDQITYVNWELAKTLGKTNPSPPPAIFTRHIKFKKQIFNKEKDINNLWKFGKLLSEQYGHITKEGEITVHGFWPVFNNRLDINGIIRIKDDRIEDGEDTTGTDNVYKIFQLEYDGFEHQTTVLVSNKRLNQKELERRVNEMKEALNGADAADPNEVISIHTIVLPDPINLAQYDTVNLYMSLHDKNGDEIDTDGYVRRKVERKSYTDPDTSTTYTALMAYFPPGNGRIKNDQFPIETIKINNQRFGVANILDSSNFVGYKRIYKWDNVGLHVTFWVEHT